MGEFSISHMLILAVILLFIFGPTRLPGLGQSLGKAIRGFKDGLNESTPPQVTKIPAKEVNVTAESTVNSDETKENSNQTSNSKTPQS